MKILYHMPALKRPHVNVEYVSNYSDEFFYKNNHAKLTHCGRKAIIDKKHDN